MSQGRSGPAADSRPIGVFDSGAGGLTVLREMRQSLPHEPTIYLGDLKHFPYGPRYPDEVRDFAFGIIRWLQTQDVKLVVIACNTATAAALNQAREVFDVPIVGVIGPGAQAAVEATRRGIIGVICTEGTRSSQEYLHAIKEVDPVIGVYQKACPELVEIVESGQADSQRAEVVLRRDLEEIARLGADVLVLGCTHYPLLKPAIERTFPGVFTLVDSASTTVSKVQRQLEHSGMLAPVNHAPGHRTVVTASGTGFADVARILFGADLGPIDEIDIWSAEPAARASSR